MCLSVSGRILITWSTVKEHLENLYQVLEKLASAGNKLNYAKCAFMLPKVKYLGHLIDEHGWHPTAKKVKAIKETPTPKNVTNSERS